ncbi:MAG: protein kinase [Myxococcales bacterium]|nr:protein kinase [Myxococcales bacterium]
MTGDGIDELARTATAVADAGTETPPVVGTVGRYRLERVLGSGAMGVVHAAYDPELERRVALKVLRSVGGEDARARLLREARAMARLKHPNVAVVHEIGTVDDRDYVAMELVDGDSLADWLRGGARTIDERLDAMIAAGRGLAAAHAAGLVHRDFKPHNVLRSREGQILVTDFGLARSLDAADMSPGGRPAADPPSSIATLTATGSFVGTPAYMAPEQWHGSKIGPATDQFAFCVTVWEALAGRRPFSADSLDELRKQIERGPGDLDTSGLPRRLRPILRRGLDPDPAHRWPSMGELLEAIRRARRSRLWIPATAVAVVALAIAAVLVTGSSPQREQPNQIDPRVLQFTKIAGGHVTAPQQAIDGLIAALKTKTGARFVPAAEGDELVGYKLYTIRSGTFFDAVGLQNGDVLTAIDGQHVDTPEHLQHALDTLGPRPKLTLDIERSGDDMTLFIEAR